MKKEKKTLLQGCAEANTDLSTLAAFAGFSIGYLYLVNSGHKNLSFEGIKKVRKAFKEICGREIMDFEDF
jgi:hypothetical protein